jgi:hypothetical protein
MSSVLKACGTRSRYVNDGCRCGPCSEANYAYMRAYQRKPKDLKNAEMDRQARAWLDSLGTSISPRNIRPNLSTSF